jgi:predicted RNA binding protein YcfA (HicA-like mRNA interferase family)
MTVYRMLRLLAAHGWRQRMRVGHFRILEHPDRPRVYIYVAGPPSIILEKADVRKILARAGIEEGSP